MLSRVLSLFLILSSVCALTAQNGPPHLDDPHHWEIHDEDGKIGEMDAFYAGYCWVCECHVYLLKMAVTHEGQTYVSWSTAYDCGDGMTLEVDNGDSGNQTEWVWENDHYKKVGGTAAVRTFHPVYKDESAGAFGSRSQRMPPRTLQPV